jgi:hypothetical protein
LENCKEPLVDASEKPWVSACRIVIFGLALLVTACEKDRTPLPKTASPTESTKPGKTDTWVIERDTFTAATQKELDQAKAAIAELKTKTQGATAKLREQLDQQSKRLDDELLAAQKKLDDAKKAGANAWTELRKGSATALEQLKESVEKARKAALG